jgi:hypothetical protein
MIGKSFKRKSGPGPSVEAGVGAIGDVAAASGMDAGSGVIAWRGRVWACRVMAS